MLAVALHVLAYNNNAPHSRLPPLGWASWVALGPGANHPVFDYCDEAGVKAAADAVVKLGFVDAGYRHFHLDDCWAGPRNSTGFLTPEADHFPNGMKVVADYVHSKGLSFGLYTCAGTETCVGGRPGSKDHWTQDANVFAEWGVDWVKMDWCNTQGMHPREAYGNMSQALNATGRPISFNMCEWGRENPWEWGGDIANSWRMSGDHTGIWASTKKQIASSAAIPPAGTGKPWGWNDMDMLETGNYEQAAHANGKESNMTALEYKTEFGMWAISASPLVVTTPVMNCSNATGPVVCEPWISDLQKEVLFNTEIIAINQDVTPQGRPICDHEVPYCLNRWSRALSDGSYAVALYNPDDAPAELSIEFGALGMPATQRATVRDLWAKKTLGVFDGRYPASGGVTVAPHEAKMLRVTPAGEAEGAEYAF